MASIQSYFGFEDGNSCRSLTRLEESMTEASPANVDALHEQRDWLLVTLSSIGDAVITTDAEGKITFLNPVAESLTGWTQEAVGQPLDGVIRLLNEDSRQP